MTERASSDKGLPYSPYFAHSVRRAWSVAARRGSAIVGLEHLLFALLDDPDALALFEGCGADIASIRVELGGVIEKATPRQPLSRGESPEAGRSLRHVLHTAGHAAQEAGKREIDGAIALATLAGQSDSPVALMLNRHGLSFGKALGWIESDGARRSPRAGEPDAAPRMPPAPHRRAPAPASARDARPAPAPAREDGLGREPTLEDMLATIRDVIDEEAAGSEATPPPPRRPPAEATRGETPLARRTPVPQQRPPAAERAEAGPARSRKAKREVEAADSAQSRPSSRTVARQSGPAPLVGKLVERIPRVMREGVREQVEVRIAREATEALIAGVKGRGAPNVHGVAVTRAMSLYLRAPDGGFMIEPLTPETQWVFDRPSFLDSEPFGRWEWVVLPMKRGSRRLQLVAAARSVDENGMIGDVALPEQIIEVSVKINLARALQKAVLWAGLAVAGGVLAQVAIRYVPGLAG